MEGKKGVARNEEGDVPETTFIIPCSIQPYYAGYAAHPRGSQAVKKAVICAQEVGSLLLRRSPSSKYEIGFTACVIVSTRSVCCSHSIIVMHMSVMIGQTRTFE
jgi:hypothetical protein